MSDQLTRDRAEIRDLMGRYLFAMDWFDADTYADCFLPDGVLDYAMGEARGRAAIREEAIKFRDNIKRVFLREDGEPAMLRHVLAYLVIRVEGDEAWTTAFWWEMTDGGPGNTPLVQSFGTYEDQVVRAGGRWLFKRRTIWNEFIEGRESSTTNPVLHYDAVAAAARKG